MAVRLDPFRRIVNVNWPSPSTGRLLQAWISEVATAPAGNARAGFYLLLEPFDAVTLTAGGVPFGTGDLAFRFTIGGVPRTMTDPFGFGFPTITGAGGTGSPAVAPLADGRNINCPDGYAEILFTDNVVRPIMDLPPTLVEVIRLSDSSIVYTQDVSAWATVRTVSGSFPTAPGNAQNYRVLP
jgi:hypothetical protein